MRARNRRAASWAAGLIVLLRLHSGRRESPPPFFLYICTNNKEIRRKKQMRRAHRIPQVLNGGIDLSAAWMADVELRVGVVRRRPTNTPRLMNERKGKNKHTYVPHNRIQEVVERVADAFELKVKIAPRINEFPGDVTGQKLLILRRPMFVCLCVCVYVCVELRTLCPSFHRGHPQNAA